MRVTKTCFSWISCIAVFVWHGIVLADNDPVADSHTIMSHPNYTITMQGGLRRQEGTARERVYTGGRILSDLTWDIEDLLFAELGLHVSLGENWTIQARYAEAISAGRGEMTNYDYLLPDVWTHFSDGEVDVNRAYMFDVHAGWTFWHDDPVDMQLLGGYRQLHWDWSQYGGNFIYSVNSFREFRGQFPAEQNGINYQQTFHIPYVGVGLSRDWQAISLGGYLHYSPLARAEGLDEHVLRNLFFTDTFSNVVYYAAGIELAYRFHPRGFVAGGWDWHRIPETRGDTRITDLADGTEERVDGGAGIANRAWSVSLSAGLQF